MAEENEGLNSVIESLLTMFSDVLNKEAIITVAESCGGDLNLAVDAIMKITDDGNTVQDVGSNNNEATLEVVPVSPPADKPSVNHNVAPSLHSNIAQNPTCRDANPPPQTYAGSAQQSSSSQSTPFQRYGAVPKVPQKISPIKHDWNDQIRRIIEYHNKGSRTLILMRGAPGSGKTQLAQKIIEMIIGGTFVNFRTHICSTDDYFMTRGQYIFNKYNLSEAHTWNQNRASLAMGQGLSPIIIDNTNIELWEMEPYVRSAVRNGYIIEVVEPNTAWARKANQLARKNIHNVPIGTIRRMLDNYENNITGNSLLKRFGLSYPSDKVPPVLRSMPAFELMNTYTPTNPSTTVKQSSYNVVPPHFLYKTLQSESQIDQQNVKRPDQNFHPNMQCAPQYIPRNTEDSNINDKNELDHVAPTSLGDVAYPVAQTSDVTDSVSQTSSADVTKPVAQTPSADMTDPAGHIALADENFDPNRDDRTTIEEEFEIIQEFNSTTEMNTVQEVDENVNLNDQYLEFQKQLEEIEKVEQEWENGENWEEVRQTDSAEAEQDNNCPKPPRSMSNTEETLANAVGNVEDWRQIAMFMPPWQDEAANTVTTTTAIPVETTTSSTSMDLGDFDQARSNLKVISTTPRDINFYHISTKKEKIPDKRMLDKSTMTNELQLVTDASRRCLNEEKHFKAFRKLFKTINKAALRDVFDQCMGDVNWAVEIVLDGVAANQFETVDDEQISDDDVSDESCTCLSAYHIVPDTTPAPQSEVASQNDNTPKVSETALVLKKPSRRDVPLSDASAELKRKIEQNVKIGENHYSEHCLKIMRFRRGVPENTVDENQPSTSQCQDTAEGGSDDEEESNASVEEVEKTVNINLGREFVAELDMLFGRTDMSYPSSLVPKINIPISLLNEINALWMESLMHQLDEHERQRAKMIQEDEDFARALALKEAELARAGRGEKEPEVLDFKEIMDMDLALSIYQRDVAEWRNKEPNDLAAKLSRDKLYSLFPDVPNDILAELLMAHENNFQSTVEVLLMSTGKEDLLEEKNGVNKFVMEAEMERQAKILEEERKALSEVEWPLLPKGEVPDMAVVNEYRDKADRHLQSRNTNYQKAGAYLHRGMLSVAGYYRELAEFHKLKFEQSNSLAAASLMQLHAAKCPDQATIDLHYLRVSEAKESLDLFIDTHIQKLKSNQVQGHGLRHHTLYFITGRGNHSHGRPRIKPAVKKRLRERGLNCSEKNPGLLSTRVCADDALTHQIA